MHDCVAVQRMSFQEASLTWFLAGFSFLSLIGLRPQQLTGCWLEATLGSLPCPLFLSMVSLVHNMAVCFIRARKPRRAREQECKQDRSQSLLQPNLRSDIQLLLPCFLFTGSVNFKLPGGRS